MTQNKKINKNYFEKNNKIKKENSYKNNYQKNNANKNKLNNNFKNKKIKNNKIIIISEINFNELKKIKKEIINNFLNNKKIEYLNLIKINNKIKYSKNIVFILDSDFEKIKEIIKIINLIKIKYLIENKKINILFIEKNNLIDLKILKNIFKNYNVIGKIKLNKKNKYLINKKTIKKLNLINN